MSRHELGKWGVNYRMENDLLLQDMAESLAVASSYLSGLEHGRKSIPEDWFERVVAAYDLSLQERTSLKVAIMRSKKRATVEVESETQARVLVAYEKGRENLTEDRVQKIEAILAISEQEEGSNEKSEGSYP